MEAVAVGGLVLVGAIYVNLSLRRSPPAYRWLALTIGCFAVGAVVGWWALRFLPPGTFKWATLKNHETSTEPVLQDAARAALPDARLTPGDTLAGVTADDICAPGWVEAHQQLPQRRRFSVYTEYGRPTPGCCMIDRLIPLGLGGSNTIRNLWLQPAGPGYGAKKQLESHLHNLVCARKLSLPDAQKCIASDWIRCWLKYVAPEHRPKWASVHRRGW